MDANTRSAIPPRQPRAFLTWAWRLIRDIVDEYSRDGVGDLAASITFWTLVSLPAAVLALVSALSSLEGIVGASVAERVRTETVGFLADTFSDTSPIPATVDQLFTSSNTGLATFATLVALFSLSRAFAGLIRALDRAYNVAEGRPWWYLRIVAIGLGLVTVVVVAASAALFAVFPAVSLPLLSRLLSMIVVFGAVVIWIALLFHIAPNHRAPFVLDLPGAVLTAVGWILIIQGFGLYRQLTADGNEVQSSVGGVLVALSLLYAMAVVLLVGAELNSVIVHRLEAGQLNPDIEDRLRRVLTKLKRRRQGRHTPPMGDVVRAASNETR